MNRFRAVSIDDEPAAHEALRLLLADIPDFDLARTFTLPSSALGALRSEHFDVLFLDVSMPEIGGLEFLRSLAAPPVTVLMTAHVEHALAAFELGVRDYLLKPVAAHRLAVCIDNIRPLLLAHRADPSARIPSRLSIKCGTLYRLIDPTRTIRVEGAGNFSTIFGEGDEVFASESMKDLQRRLEPLGFVRIHKSHLVNLRYVGSVSSAELILTGGCRLPIGRAYRPALEAALRNAVL